MLSNDLSKKVIQNFRVSTDLENLGKSREIVMEFSFERSGKMPQTFQSHGNILLHEIHF